MSCKTCEEIQEKILNKDYPFVYVRIGRSNIAIIGCQEHLKQLLEQLKQKNQVFG